MDTTLADLLHKLNNRACSAIGRIELIEIEKLDLELQTPLIVIKRNLEEMREILQNINQKLIDKFDQEEE